MIINKTDVDGIKDISQIGGSSEGSNDVVGVKATLDNKPLGVFWSNLGLSQVVGGDVRIEIFSVVLDQKNVSDFIEFPKANELFNSVCGCYFADFIGRRPGEVERQSSLGRSFCRWNRQGKVLSVKPCFHDEKFQSCFNKGITGGSVHHWPLELEEEIRDVATNSLPEEIAFDEYARKYGVSRHCVMYVYARVIGSVLSLVKGNKETSSKTENTNDFRLQQHSSLVFVGIVGLDDKLILRKSFVVMDVRSESGAKRENVNLPSLANGSWNIGEFVAGLDPQNGKPFVFKNDDPALSPVQIVRWGIFKEAKTGMSAMEFFTKNKSGELSSLDSYLIGGKHPGHIIVVDGETYLKGFKSIGNGIVEYSLVSKYDGDFVAKVVSGNRSAEFEYHRTKIAILVPYPSPVNGYYSSGRHSVIDCQEWLPLTRSELVLKESAIPPDAIGPDVVEKSSAETRKTIYGVEKTRIMEEVDNEGVLPRPEDTLRKSETAIEAQEIRHGDVVSDVPERNVAHLKAMTDGCEIKRFVQMGSNGGEPPRFSSPRSRDCEWDATELEFLSNFDKYVSGCGFRYETADLVRLHTSVKCSMCTLLAGSPGTGKSSLAELYMRAVAGSSGKNDSERSWRQIFVNPAWMEPADLLGYETDSKEDDGGFRHAPSHLAEFIRNISEDEKLPIGIVCFEEMNLACVEHYFSDFVQVMSQGRGVIPGCKDHGKDLCVEPNFRVIGTCNSDETTRTMSPRFLSRCNTIELSSSFKTTKSLVADLADGKIPKIKSFEGGESLTRKCFEDWCKSSDARSIDDGIVNAILSLLEPKDEDESVMSSAGLDMSGRIVTDMFKYIRNRPPYKEEGVVLSELDRQKVALDEFLAQRVFFVCRPTPGTINGIAVICDKVDNGFEFKVDGKGDRGMSTQRFTLPLSASLLKRRISDYKRTMQV